MPTSWKVRPCIRTRSCHRRTQLIVRHSTTDANPIAPRLSDAPPSTYKSRFSNSALSYHWDTVPPTPEQLAHANKFFEKVRPTFLWSAEKFKTMDYGDSPEVCFLGRSNVGKSSLLNALLCKNIAHTSSKPGRTRLMNAFAVGGPEVQGKSRLVVLDMPGYGKGGRAEWGTQILKYVEKRKQLKRAFLLVDAEHGIKEGDKQILQLFKDRGVPYQVVVSKVDKIVSNGSRELSAGALETRLAQLRRTMESIKEAVQPEDPNEEAGGEAGIGEVISCSSSKWMNGQKMGIHAVRFAMLRAAGLEFQPKVKLGKLPDIVSFDELFGPDGP